MTAHNKKSLKYEIEALLLSKEPTRKIQYEDLIYTRKNIKIFKKNSHNLTSETIKAYEINLSGKEIAVSQGQLLIIDHNNTITIYNYDDNLKLKKIRKMRIHLLLFLTKTNSLSTNCKMVFYNILLTLVKQQVQRIDTFLEDIMMYLEVDKLSNMFFHKEYLVCKYKNGSVTVYDNKLAKVNNFIGNIRSEMDDMCFDKDTNVHNIDYERVSLHIKRNTIEINHKEKSFIEVVDVPGMIQCVYIDNLIFMLMEESIKILKFV
ncbi:hypothetical protein EDEG_03352 [Edhazardia aedis USNM 41457]|uniref:Uncharacterized protein n=1 Tax=Edhazardia aedis (strain USNM 41457) TaxID=1003232 RepID=J8ZR78_EDHAE|nr:hypothetical protein EDEG_03352 [Edhazardia aedis USNM 41457]|eukprot:EJW02198.1 hypothetical protein EDEG_03352 [Edhazardia aedis USNM 41457]